MPASNELIIEIATANNNDVVFKPSDQQMLRGRKTRAGWGNTTFHSHPERNQMLNKEIPGLHIGLDAAERRARIFDPLADPKYKILLTEIESLITSFGVAQGKPQPCPDQIRENLSDNDIATWLHWMRRLVGEKKAIVRQGEISKKVKGRVQVSFGIESPDQPRYEDEWERYRKYGSAWNDPDKLAQWTELEKAGIATAR